MYKPWPDGDFSIVADDLATGATRTLYSTPTYLRTVALAPDGSTIAFWADNRKRAELMRMPAAGGEPTSIYSVPSGSVRQGVLEFSPDGRWLYYVAQESAGLDAPNKLMRVSAGGGKPEETGLSTSLLARFSIHPNGDRIAFSSGRRSEEVWVLENFAPGTRTASARKP
jgi:Tol biopolymer transport system component